MPDTAEDFLKKYGGAATAEPTDAESFLAKYGKAPEVDLAAFNAGTLAANRADATATANEDRAAYEKSVAEDFKARQRNPVEYATETAADLGHKAITGAMSAIGHAGAAAQRFLRGEPMKPPMNEGDPGLAFADELASKIQGGGTPEEYAAGREERTALAAKRSPVASQVGDVAGRMAPVIAAGGVAGAGLRAAVPYLATAAEAGGVAGTAARAAEGFASWAPAGLMDGSSKPEEAATSLGAAGAILGALSPALGRVEAALGGRLGRAVKSALEGGVVELTPHIKDGTLDFHPTGEGFVGNALPFLVMGQIGGKFVKRLKEQGLSDETIKTVLPEIQKTVVEAAKEFEVEAAAGKALREQAKAEATPPEAPMERPAGAGAADRWGGDIETPGKNGGGPTIEGPEYRMASRLRQIRDDRSLDDAAKRDASMAVWRDAEEMGLSNAVEADLLRSRPLPGPTIDDFARRALDMGEENTPLRRMQAHEREAARQTSGGPTLRLLPKDVPAERPAQDRLTPKAPSPAEPAPGEPTTSIKNRVVEEYRDKRGMEPLPDTERFTDVAAMEGAKKEMERNPGAGRQLVAELKSNPRPHTKEDVAILNIEMANRQAHRDAVYKQGVEAFERGDQAAIDKANKDFTKAEAELNDIQLATKQAGGKTGQALQARKIEIAADYSPVRVEQRMRAAKKFKPLTVEEAAQVKEMTGRLKALEDKIAAHEVRMSEIEAQKAAEKIVQRGVRGVAKEYGEGNRIVTKVAYEKTKAELREKLGRLNAGIDPTILADLVKMGTFHLEAGARSFARWAAKMKEDFGEKVVPHLEAIYAESKKQTVSEKIRERVKNGESVANMPAEVGKLAEMFVRSGVTDREQLINEVHGLLSEIHPEITRRQTMDAISGYGKLRALNMEDAKVKLRELKGQMQQVAKLEDIAAGKKPLKSGIERQPPGEVQRELIKLVNEAKKEKGVDVESQIKAVERSIEDYNQRIAKGDVFPAKPEQNPTGNERLDALRKQRDELRQVVEDMRASALPVRSKVEGQLRALDKSIKEYERRLAAGDVFPEKVEPRLADPRVEQMRAKRDELKAQLEDLRAAATPRKSDYEVAIQTIKTRLKNEIADLQDRLKTGDYEKPKKAPTPLDAEAVSLEAQRGELKKEIDKAIFQKEIEQRTLLQKAAEIPFRANNLSRAVMTSFDVSAPGRQGLLLGLSHPVLAARSLPGMFRAFGSKKFSAEAEARIRLDPDYVAAKKAGLFLAEHGEVSREKMEEAFNSRDADRIPGVAGSQRAYTTFLNKLRFDTFKTLLHNLPPDIATAKDARDIAHFVNVATGRGGGIENGKFTQALAGFHPLLFSPRLMASRFQMLAGSPMWNTSGAAKKIIVKEYARMLAGIAVVYGLSKLAGADVDLRPTSTDFGKIKVGNTRIDPTAGIASTARLVSRLGVEAKHSLAGEKHDRDALEETGQFLRYKFSPALGAATELLTGKDFKGDPITPGRSLGNLFTPLTFQGEGERGSYAFFTGGDIYKAMKEHGVPGGVAVGLASLFGLGVQNYEAKKPKKRK